MTGSWCRMDARYASPARRRRRGIISPFPRRRMRDWLHKAAKRAPIAAPGCLGVRSCIARVWVEVCALSALCALWVEVCALSALCALWVEVCALSALCAIRVGRAVVFWFFLVLERGGSADRDDLPRKKALKGPFSCGGMPIVGALIRDFDRQSVTWLAAIQQLCIFRLSPDRPGGKRDDIFVQRCGLAKVPFAIRRPCHLYS